jgi:hypothetical protein
MPKDISTCGDTRRGGGAVSWVRGDQPVASTINKYIYILIRLFFKMEAGCPIRLGGLWAK